MVQVTPHYQTKTVTLDASGQGTVFLGPEVAGTRWTLTNMVTTGNSIVQPVFMVYRGNVAPHYLMSGSMAGNLDANSDRITLQGNEKLACQYTGGTPGAVMTVNITAEQEYGV